MTKTDKQAVLYAYSEGRMGWRSACGRLALLDIAELHETLLENDLPLPIDNVREGSGDGQ